MIDMRSSASPDTLELSLRRSFVGGAQWPLDRAGLTALIDMGLSERQIADYFSVSADDVHRVREDYSV